MKMWLPSLFLVIQCSYTLAVAQNELTSEAIPPLLRFITIQKILAYLAAITSIRPKNHL